MMKLLVPVLVLINVALTATVLALGLTGQLMAIPIQGPPEPEAGKLGKQAYYYEFKPELVVNFPGKERPRYMQIALTAVTYDEQALDAIELHSPAIRNDLLLRFTGREAGPMATREGKESLRAEALEIVRSVMKERYGSESVDDVYFTRFVLQ